MDRNGGGDCGGVLVRALDFSVVSARDEIIRTALHAIRTGMPTDQAVTNAVDAALEHAGVSKALQEHVDLRAVATREDIDEVSLIAANRRNPPAPPKPTGKNTDSPWWGKGEK